MRSAKTYFRDESLRAAVDRAIAGDRTELFDRVRRASGLPGPRLNVLLVESFAAEAVRRGAAIDGLLAAMLAVNDEIAPYGHVDEVLPVLGVAGVGARGASDAGATRAALEDLEEASCDRRFRVRDEVGRALASIGAQVGPSFLEVLKRWGEDEQTFLACAVAAALGEARLLVALGEKGSATILDALCRRIEREHRAGRRHDAFRRLVHVFEEVPAVVLGRYPRAVDVLLQHARSDDEDLRGAIQAALANVRARGGGEAADAVSGALTATEKPPRDPRHQRLPGKRGRGRR